MYRPSEPPVGDQRAWLLEELRRISDTSSLELDVLHVVPDRPRDGLVVMADGTDWNPGSGAGVYAYQAGAWHFLG